jgi:protocatechuate 3,4-dioxygenase beta subunit
VRSDIRENRPGVALKLGVRVRSAGECAPIKDAVVDLWHCDAGGVYSGIEAGEGERFLRGTQVTNAEGIAQFTTIYPGWYRGRTVHIHAKVHLDKQTVLTTLYHRTPYSTHSGRDPFNDQDGIFDAALVMTVNADGDGYRGLMTFDVRAAA